MTLAPFTALRAYFVPHDAVIGSNEPACNLASLAGAHEHVRLSPAATARTSGGLGAGW
jgi:hypothetical protein